MTFTTKFELGDELYFLDDGKKIRKGKVTIINYIRHVYDDEHCSSKCESYTLKTNVGLFTYNGDDLFKTKEELIESLD